MQDLTLRLYPDPILRQAAFPVDVFDEELRDFAESLVATMGREGGIGLAAPQVGVSRRIIVALQMRSTDDTGAPPLVLVNPKITASSRDTWTYEEGCLSLPGITGNVIRPERIGVEYQDVEGNAHHIEAEGMFARVLLHEVDHLDGRLFIDYLSTAAKSLIKPKLKQLAEEQSA